jgi:hypothetical protein
MDRNPPQPGPRKQAFDHSCTATTSDAQEREERARWDARRRRHERATEGLLAALYPTQAGKSERMGALRRQEEEFVAARAAEKCAPHAGGGEGEEVRRRWRAGVRRDA